MTAFIRFYIWLSVLVAILLLISFPTPEYNGTMVSYYDKVIHVIMFGAFAWVTYWWLSSYQKITFQFRLTLSGIIAVLYAALGEVIQGIVPGRDVSELDFAAGFLGVVFVIAFNYVKDKHKLKT